MQVPHTYDIFPIHYHRFSLLLQIYGDFEGELSWTVYIYFRINSLLCKKQLLSGRQYPTFPNPLVGEGAGETGVKSILFGEYNFSCFSKSLSLCKHKILPSFSMSQILCTTTTTCLYCEELKWTHSTILLVKQRSKLRITLEAGRSSVYERIYQESWIIQKFLGSYKTSTHGNTLPGSSFHPTTGLSAFLLEHP